MLAGYPLPNDPQGPFGARTYATSTKVRTDTNQFSMRIDHRISGRAQLFTRFNINNVSGPLTNPSQPAIDPSVPFSFSTTNATPRCVTREPSRPISFQRR